jgi:iron complex transport system substrate-binding protein
MQQRIAAVQAKIAGQPQVKVIYYDAGEGPLGIFGKGAWEYVLTLAGGQNVFGDSSEGYMQISAEQVAARDTDIFIVARYTAEGVKTTEERIAYLKATFPNSTAVKNNRVIAIPYEYTNPGLQNVEGVEALARALYPELFR